MLCINISIYTEPNNKPKVYTTKNSFFTSQIAITREHDLLYTQSQAQELADSDTELQKFLKPKSYKEENKEVDEVKMTAKIAMKSLVEFTGRVDDLVDSLCELEGKNNTKEFSAAMGKLIQTSLSLSEISCDKSFNKVDENFSKTMSNIIADFRKKEEVNAAIQFIENSFKKPKIKEKHCNECGNTCANYSSFTVKCNHTLDQPCFEKYIIILIHRLIKARARFNLLDFDTMNCMKCVPVEELKKSFNLEKCKCGSDEDLREMTCCQRMMCRKCLKQ